MEKPTEMTLEIPKTKGSFNFDFCPAWSMEEQMKQNLKSVPSPPPPPSFDPLYFCLFLCRVVPRDVGIIPLSLGILFHLYTLLPTKKVIMYSLFL